MKKKTEGEYLAPEFEVVSIDLMQLIATSLEGVGIEPSPEDDETVGW